MMKKIKPGEAQFTRHHPDARTSCLTCGYFSPSGNRGWGECLMGVPEANFRFAVPVKSTCKYWTKETPK